MATAPNDVIRAVLGFTYTQGGKPLSNVFHFADTGGGGILDVDFINGFGLIIEAIYAPIKARQSQKLFFINIQVQNVTQALIIGTLVWPTFVAGDEIGTPDVSQAAGLVRMITPKPRVQGRVYVPGWPESAIGEGAFLTPDRQAMADLGVNLLAPRALGVGELTYCVFNQVFKTFTLPTSAAFGVNTRGLNRRKLA